MSSEKVVAAQDVEDGMSKIVNLAAESDTNLQELATNKNVALLAFIAPYIGVRTSPVTETYASISLAEELGVELALERLESQTDSKHCYLLINSPGGAMHSSYKIALALRRAFEKITVFVPHVALSGGTLLALTGDEIVMGTMSHISPLDVQLSYRDTSISAAVSVRAFQRCQEWFETKSRDEAPYPQRAMVDKLDPFIMEEWGGHMESSLAYVSEILTLANYENSEEIAKIIVAGFPSHSFVINREAAKDIGLRVEDPSEYGDVWDIMRSWLSKYLLEQAPSHHIRYVLPAHREGGSDDA